MEDVFNQLGGFEVGDYDDEDEQIDQPVQKKSKSHLWPDFKFFQSN